MEKQEILRVDLTTGDTAREPVPENLLRTWIGGKGLAAHYLSTGQPAGVDPLGPENQLIFMTGPASGLFPGTCRHAVVTKSPATGGFLDSYAGGWFAWELRKLGLLGIVLRGRAPRLSYLEVTDQGATLVEADDLAGKAIDEVDDDPRFAGHRVAAIGPAGENRVLMACIGNNAGRSKSGRSGYNGRGGAGAVMGAKNLKAIALKSRRRPLVPLAVQELRRELSLRAKEGPAAGPLARVGTAVGVALMNEVHVLPTRNFRAGSFPDVEAVNDEAVSSYRVGQDGCFNCPVRCGINVRAPLEGAFPGAEAPRLEYETIGLGASNTGNRDFSSIVTFSALCDRLGLDTISAGAAVAFAMDCAERGLIESRIRFGDGAGQALLAEDIAHRRGLGQILADGVRAAAVAWGIDEKVVPALHVKGLEFPAYDPRGSVGMGLAFATSDRGACHNRSWPIGREALSADPAADPFGPGGKAAGVAADQDASSVKWSLVVCDFLGYDLALAARMLDALGIHTSPLDLSRLGTRIWTLIRLFNLREGWTAGDDTLPAALALPLEDSGRRLSPEVFRSMLGEYYAVREWDSEGRPTPGLLVDLGIQA